MADDPGVKCRRHALRRLSRVVGPCGTSAFRIALGEVFRAVLFPAVARVDTDSQRHGNASLSVLRLLRRKNGAECSQFSQLKDRSDLPLRKPSGARKGADMAYFIDLFSPETYEAFAHSSRDISGFPLRHKS